MGDTKREIGVDCFLPQVVDEGQRYGRNKGKGGNRGWYVKMIF